MPADEVDGPQGGEYLDELVDALREDAEIMRAAAGSKVRFNYDDAADAIVALRAEVERVRDA